MRALIASVIFLCCIQACCLPKNSRSGAKMQNDAMPAAMPKEGIQDLIVNIGARLKEQQKELADAKAGISRLKERCDRNREIIIEILKKLLSRSVDLECPRQASSIGEVGGRHSDSAFNDLKSRFVLALKEQQKQLTATQAEIGQLNETRSEDKKIITNMFTKITDLEVKTFNEGDADIDRFLSTAARHLKSLQEQLAEIQAEARQLKERFDQDEEDIAAMLKIIIEYMSEPCH
jgi:chromosome segregation ATPase